MTLSGAGRGLILATAASFASLVVSRALGVQIAAGWFIALAAAGLPAGALVAVRRAPSRMDLAAVIDRHLRLKDRVSTAESVLAGRLAPASDADFARLTVRDAERFAAKVHLPAVAPIRMSRAWPVAAAMVAALVAGILYLPVVVDDGTRRAGSASGDRPSPPALEQQRADLAREIQSAAEEANAATADDPLLDDELDALERLARQIESGAADAADVSRTRDEAAATLADAAHRLNARSERDEAALDALAERFRSLETPEAPMTASEFVDALRRGDFGDAARTVDELERSAGRMTDDERRRAAASLREVGRQMAEDAMPGSPGPDRPGSEPLEDTLRDLGVEGERARELLEQPPATSTDQARKEFERENLDPEVAEHLARELHELHHRRQAEQDAAVRARALEESLRDLADRLEQPGPQRDAPSPPAADPPTEPPAPTGAEEPIHDSSNPEQRPSQESPPSQREDRQQQDRQQQDRQQQDGPGATPQRGTQPARPGESQPGAAPQQEQAAPAPGDARQPETSPDGAASHPKPDAGAENPPGAADAPAQPPHRSPTGGSSQAQPRPEPAPGADDAATGPRESIGGPQRGEDQPAPEPRAADPVREPSAGAEPGANKREIPDGDQTIPKPGEQAIPDRAPPSPADRLRELDRLRDVLQRNRSLAERLRQRAAELADTMSDEEKQRWAEQWRRQMGDQPPQSGDAPRAGMHPPQPGDNATQTGSAERSLAGDSPAPATSSNRPPGPGTSRPAIPFESEDLDLALDEQAERIMAEWLSDELPADVPGRAQSAEGSGRVRHARRVAERAVNETAVPPRYRHLIRRYFGRLDETVDRAGSGAAEKQPERP